MNEFRTICDLNPYINHRSHYLKQILDSGEHLTLCGKKLPKLLYKDFPMDEPCECRTCRKISLKNMNVAEIAHAYTMSGNKRYLI